jgi:carboxynorspermidine decarboxylase
MHLDGVTASSLYEAKLGREIFGGEVHLCAPAYKEEEFDSLLACADHVVFNSLSQFELYRPRLDSKSSTAEAGIRINPQHSETSVSLYDPCARFSRLGVPASRLSGLDPADVDGLHFHNLCEGNADSLSRTLRVVEDQCGALLGHINWINFGGGHHISRHDYNSALLCGEILRFKDRYGVQVYLEPGEAAVLNAGVLVSSVLDIVCNEKRIAVMDTSASAHMPDVLEMPYRPEVAGAGAQGELKHDYRLAGNTCLAGDVTGDYSFDNELKPGRKLVFRDMAHYTIVKATTFNGLRLPNIYLFDSSTGRLDEAYRYSYGEFARKNAANPIPC